MIIKKKTFSLFFWISKFYILFHMHPHIKIYYYSKKDRRRREEEEGIINNIPPA